MTAPRAPGYFHQDPPRLANQYLDDRVLRSYLRRVLPASVLASCEGELGELGELAGGELYALQLADRLNEPRLTRWDAWGKRIDDIEVSPLWQRAEEIAVRFGLVATAYEAEHGALSRIDQFARVYLFTASADIYSCPLAMTDGAARTLIDSGHQKLIERAVPRLTSRDPSTFWTSGQWMTESTGGSDVGRSETVARRDGDDRHRLYGRKWFTSATTAQMALTLARPEGNSGGGRGLALFFVETHDDSGRLLPELRVLRLKDKLGTRKVPTAELALDGVVAEPVLGLHDGVRQIAPMLNITRVWNSVSAVSLMRRGLALAIDFARRRQAFGALLIDKPLHVDTLAGLQAELEGAFHLTFRVVELLGRHEAKIESEGEAALLRLLTPVVKLVTGKQAVAVTSEVLEAFGGAGYVEDTGLPMLLRDAQVLPIWEGTTNVLSLDTLRALREGEALPALRGEVARCLAGVRSDELVAPSRKAAAAIDSAIAWLEAAMDRHTDEVEAGARRFAMTVGRSLEVLLLCVQAQWSFDQDGDGRPAAAARRLARQGIDQIVDFDPVDARLLFEEA